MKNEWQSRVFEDCIDTITYTKKIQRKDFLDMGEYPIISQEDAFINGYWNNKDDLFHVDRPIIVFGDHTRALKYVDFDFVLGADGVKILKPKGFLHPKFFYYQLHTAQLDSLGYARHSRLLKDIEISYPEFSEQQRIASILDKVFDGIITAESNAKKNLESSQKLFEHYLDLIFSNLYNGGVFPIVNLSELTSDITDGDHMPPPKQSSGIPFITISNINKKTNLIDFSDTFTVSSEYFHNLKRNRKPLKGDVLYTVTGSFGIPVAVMDDREFCFQRHIALIRPTTQTNTTWLYYLMLSSCIFKQAFSESTGTAQKTVPLKVLRNFKVPKLPLPEQRLIVNKLDLLSFETKRLESIYAQKLIALDELKKSLLHKAFNGEFKITS